MLVQDHGLLAEMIMVTNSTDVGHIIDEDGESACGRFEYDLDEIHEDDTWSPGNKKLCDYCDREVPDELQAELFTDSKFELVDGLTTA